MSRSPLFVALASLLSLCASPARAQIVCPTVQWSAQGPIQGGQFGRAVAFIDANHDGYADLLVGGTGAASVSLCLGSPTATEPPEPPFRSPPTFTYTGQAGSLLGTSIAVGDFNHDGWDDFAVGAPLNAEGGVLVFLGGASGFSSSPAVTLSGPVGSNFGVSLCAGDFDGDGIADLAVGAPTVDVQGSALGQVFVYKGESPFPSSLGAMNGPSAGSQFGASVAAVDIDGDNHPEIIVGAPGTSTGAVEAFHCNKIPPPSSFTPFGTISGEAIGDQFGTAVCGIPSLQPSGSNDLLVGAPFHAGVGRAYLMQGSSSGLTSVVIWQADGEQSGGQFGIRLAGADVTSDGRPDILVSAPAAGLGGRVYLFPGMTVGFSPTAGQVFEGEESGSNFGLGLAAERDLNNEGLKYVVVGAPRRTNGLPGEPGSFMVGEVYAYLGGICDNPVAALATWIESEPIDGGVRLAWYAPRQTLVQVDRRTITTDWQPLGLASADGADRLTYEDHQAVVGERYRYRIEIAGVPYGEAWVTIAGPELALAGFPTNPGTSHPMISFRLANSAPARLEVLDLKGRFVYQREVGSLGPGDHTVSWEGAPLGAGVYWIQLRQGTTTRRVKGIVLP